MGARRTWFPWVHCQGGESPGPDHDREKSYAELFDQLDLNKDGRIDIVELRTGLAGRGLSRGSLDRVGHLFIWYHALTFTIWGLWVLHVYLHLKRTVVYIKVLKYFSWSMLLGQLRWSWSSCSHHLTACEIFPISPYVICPQAAAGAKDINRKPLLWIHTVCCSMLGRSVCLERSVWVAKKTSLTVTCYFFFSLCVCVCVYKAQHGIYFGKGSRPL